MCVGVGGGDFLPGKMVLDASNIMTYILIYFELFQNQTFRFSMILCGPNKPPHSSNIQNNLIHRNRRGLLDVALVEGLIVPALDRGTEIDRFTDQGQKNSIRNN